SRSRRARPRPDAGTSTAGRTRARRAPRSRSPFPGTSRRAGRRRRRASIQRSSQSLGQVAPAQLLLGLTLDLADALAREPQLLPDLLQRPRLLAVEAEPHLDDALLLLVQLLQHRPADLRLEGALHELQLHRR